MRCGSMGWTGRRPFRFNRIAIGAGCVGFLLVSWHVALDVGQASAEPAAAGASGKEASDKEISVKKVKELLDTANTLLEEGKPGKAATRVAEASKAIEQIAAGGTTPAGLRILWERCRSLRNDLDLEGVDVSDISQAPLRPSAAKPAGKSTGMPPVASRSTAAANPVAKPPATTKPAAAAKPALTFTASVAPILSRHCGGCHIAGRKGGFQMVSHAGLMKTGMVQPGMGEASRLVEVILSGDMPRGGGKVSPEDLGVLMKWIDAGAPFDGPDPTAPIDVMARQATAGPAPAPARSIVAVKLKPGEVSFAADIAPILLEQCAGCHDAVQPEGNLSMVTLERLLRGGRGGAAIVPGQGIDSLLVKKIKGSGIEGQRMPLGKQPLSAEVIATIQKWIDQGAKLDLLTPKTDLETVAAAGRSQQFSHDDLRKVRFQAGRGLWARAIPDETPVVSEQGNVLVVGNLSAGRMGELTKTAEAVERRLQDQMLGEKAAAKKTPLVKGGIVVYGFAKSYDLSSFWQTVFSDDRPKGVTSGAGATGDVVFAAVIPATADTPEATADARVVLTEQMATASLLGRGVPAWFARGAGRALAMKAEPKSSLVQAWRRELPAAVHNCGSPADFFAGHGDPAAAAVVEGGFVSVIMPNASRLEILVQHLDEGMAFDQAFASVFRSPPQPLFESWVAQAARPAAGKSPRR
jgi:hypothetical protein